MGLERSCKGIGWSFGSRRVACSGLMGCVSVIVVVAIFLDVLRRAFAVGIVLKNLSSCSRGDSYSSKSLPLHRHRAFHVIISAPTDSIQDAVRAMEMYRSAPGRSASRPIAGLF